jgi:hypothetical protein
LNAAARTPTYGVQVVHREGGTMSLESRIESLKGRHASLEDKIHDEDSRPRPDGDSLNRLKLEKLRLKEEMDRLQRAG